MFRAVCAASFLLLWGLPAPAALDPERGKPYALRIILRVAEHPSLTRTSVFKDRVERELRDGMQAALGELAVVTVVSYSDVRNEPIVKEVEAKGLEKALDEWRELSGVKNHFVFIDYVDGRYEIQARQHDGLTGLASPVVRRAQVRDRDLVARSAALLLDRDFGAVGTITEVKGLEVQVTLKGADLQAGLDRWVKEGEVFALAQIQKVGAGQQARQREWALLQVLKEPFDGTVPCRLYHRHNPPLPEGSGFLGYRCLKLGTDTAPLRLRLVRSDRTESLPSAVVRVGKDGFPQPGAKADEEQATNLYLPVTTAKSYAHVAFVTVERGKPIAQLPVPIIEGRTAVAGVTINPENERRGQLDLDRDRWVRRVYDNLQAHAVLLKDLQALVGKRENEKALKQAKVGLESLEADLTGRTAELVGLRQSAKDLAVKEPDLEEGERLLKTLETHKEQLQQSVDQLNKTLQEEQDPKRLSWAGWVNEAKLKEDAAEFGEALKLYQQALDDGADSPELKQKVQQLRTAWEAKDPLHQKARAFLYETWARLETAEDMRAHVDEARKAFFTCREAQDRLTPQKLLKVNNAHAGRLKQRQEEGGDSPDQEKETKLIAEVSKKLAQLTQEVVKYLSEGREKP